MAGSNRSKHDVGGIADRVPARVHGHFAKAFEQMKAMQPNPLGAFPANKNARNAIWNKLVECFGIENRPGQNMCADCCPFFQDTNADLFLSCL